VDGRLFGNNEKPLATSQGLNQLKTETADDGEARICTAHPEITEQMKFLWVPRMGAENKGSSESDFPSNLVEHPARMQCGDENVNPHACLPRILHPEDYNCNLIAYAVRT
jgi:hypothetical protein